MPLALVLIALAVGWRIVAAHQPDLVNFSPLMALTFCGAIYLRDRRLWLVPFVALIVSDLYLDHYYATAFNERWNWPSSMVRTLCFAAALALGWAVAKRKNWLNLFSGALGGALFFYFVTNTDSWLRDPNYVKSAAGWWQAMTIGRPEFPPTFYFFRNTLISDLLFTGIFALTMEYASLRAGQTSLLAKRSAA